MSGEIRSEISFPVVPSGIDEELRSYLLRMNEILQDSLTGKAFAVPEEATTITNQGALATEDAVDASDVQGVATAAQIALIKASLLANWRLDIADTAGRPAGIYPTNDITDFSGLDWLDGDEAEIKIAHVSDTTIAYGFPAIPIDDKQKYTIVIRHKAPVASGSGLYLGLQEYNAALPVDKTHIGGTGAGTNTQVRTSDSFLVSDGPFPGTSWEVDEYTYTPTAGTKYASFTMYNWSGAGTKEYHVDYVLMYVVPKTADEIGDGSTYGIPPKNWMHSSNVTKIDGGKIYAKSIDVATGAIGDLAVDTLQIANNAVTFMVAAYTAGQLSYGDVLWHEAQTITITTIGQPVVLSFSIQWFGDHFDGMDIRVQRDGSDVYLTHMSFLASYGNPFSVSIVDEPNAAEHIYDLDIRCTPVSGAKVLSFRHRSLIAKEIKK